MFRTARTNVAPMCESAAHGFLHVSSQWPATSKISPRPWRPAPMPCSCSIGPAGTPRRSCLSQTTSPCCLFRLAHPCCDLDRITPGFIQAAILVSPAGARRPRSRGSRGRGSRPAILPDCPEPLWPATVGKIGCHGVRCMAL